MRTYLHGHLASSESWSSMIWTPAWLEWGRLTIVCQHPCPRLFDPTTSSYHWFQEASCTRFGFEIWSPLEFYLTIPLCHQNQALTIWSALLVFSPLMRSCYSEELPFLLASTVEVKSWDLESLWKSPSHFVLMLIHSSFGVRPSR